MALFSRSNRRRAVRKLQSEVDALREILPAEAFQGRTMASPFVELEEDARGTWTVPWRRRDGSVTETTVSRELVPAGVAVASSPYATEADVMRPPMADITEAVDFARAPARVGYLADIPRGGATEFNQGYTQIGGATDRRTLMEQLQQLYVNCPWSKACVDTIARFCSAGGMNIEPDNASKERLEVVTLPAQAQKAQALFDFVNPAQNFRQLMRTIFTDLLIYGDSFVEVVWALGEPVALYSLPCPQMLIDADEHGNVNFYIQRTDTDRRAQFEPHQVIHIKMDSPRGGLYGLGPTEGCVHAITTWLFTEGLLKATMKRGNPLNLGIAWDPDLGTGEIKRFSQQYATRNLGPDNVGNPVEVKGKTELHEFAQNKIAEYQAIKNGCRDEMCGEYGAPPAIVSIIESGNLGGGTGTSQFKNFRVNTCGPLEELVLEAFTFAILEQGFGVEGYRCTFDEVDWRDDETIEKIRTMRVERGGWSFNRYADDIGEPPVEGGDDRVIILARDVVPLKDVAAKSTATLPPEIGADEHPDAPTGSARVAAPAPAPGAATQADNAPPKHAKGAPESLDDLAAIFEADLNERRARALRADRARRRRQEA